MCRLSFFSLLFLSSACLAVLSHPSCLLRLSLTFTQCCVSARMLVCQSLTLDVANSLEGSAQLPANQPFVIACMLSY